MGAFLGEDEDYEKESNLGSGRALGIRAHRL